jgi:hypothetical protein
MVAGVLGFLPSSCVSNSKQNMIKAQAATKARQLAGLNIKELTTEQLSELWRLCHAGYLTVWTNGFIVTTA